MSFFDGGNKSLNFGERGDNKWRGVWQGGVILNIGQPVVSMGYPDTSKPKTFKNGETVHKIVISLDTKVGRFPAPPIDAEDDQTRDWHVDKGFGQYRAIGKALRDAKVKDLEVGGTLYVQWVGGEGAIGDPRQFQAAYQPPTGTGGFMQDAVAPPVQPPAPTPPAAFLPTVPVPPPLPAFPPQVPLPTAQTAPVPSAPYGYNPMTDQPLAAPPAANPAPYGYNPQTGQPNPAPPASAAAGPVTNPFAQ